MDAAYAAGILDGEGCLGIGRNKKAMTYDARVYVGMTEKALGVLERLQAAFGGTLRKHREKTKRWSAAWMWTVSGKDAVPLLLMAMPHMILKVRQARLLLDLEALKPRKRNSWTDELRQQALALRLTVLDLNRKGPDVSLKPPFPGAKYVRDVDGFLMEERTPDLFDDSAWQPFSGRFGNSGTTAPGGFWTLNTSESRSAADGYSACSLAEVLLPDAPPKYWLSPKAAAGILRRAEKRGRELPEPLALALRALAGGTTSTEAVPSSPPHP